MLVPGAYYNLVLVLIVNSLAPQLGGPTPIHPAPFYSKGLVLSPLIRHYEPARYDPGELGAQHRRVRRSPGSKGGSVQQLRLDIRTSDRVFKLRLRPDPNVFAEDVEFTSTSGPVTFDPTTVYSGTLEDDETASVHGVITSDGLFDGTITTTLDEFYVEPVSRYLGTGTCSEPLFHTVFYKGTDVVHPSKNKRHTGKSASSPGAEGNAPCASQTLHEQRLQQYRSNGVGHGMTYHRAKRWMPPELDHRHIYTHRGIIFATGGSNINTTPTSWGVTRPPPKRRPNRLPPLFDLNTPYNDQNDGLVLADDPNNNLHVELKPRKPKDDVLVSDEDDDDAGNLSYRHFNKRATVDPKKTTCMLYLQADHQFFQKFGTEESCIEVMTRHVQRVNSIYKTTDFNSDGKSDNITFMIKRIKVHTVDALKDPLYRFPDNYGVEKFLELFSEEDYDAFCLAYMFTYRDFEMGTLGLAWTGDLKNAGGVCEKNGHYRGSMKSLNTGIVTLLNYGKHVPPAVSHVTLAHEIGHNFGSPHDPEVCTPGGEDGNFIMFARATSGDKKNNNHFSPCSIKSINPVLNYKARSTKGCFTEPQRSLCGNGVVEDGEECDCGWEEDCRDQCCHPQRRYPPPDEPPCRLTARGICSPSQGPCCTSDCKLKFGDKCRDDNGCRDASFCNGRGPQCPPSVNKPNKTICNQEFVCFMGECTGSICLAYGLESCQCKAEPHEPATKACELCCKMPGDGQPCLSSFVWNEMPFDVPDMYSKPGTPCNDYNGYCDVFQKCREVDPSGPLATLRKLLLSEESIQSYKKWIIEYWYAVVFIILAVIGLLVMSTKLLGKRPNMKLKSVTIMHSSTTETVRLPPEGESAGGQVTVHPAVRSKLPLKRKVRDGKKARARNNNTNRTKNKEPASPTTGAGTNNLSPAKKKSLKTKKDKKKDKTGRKKATNETIESPTKVKKTINSKVSKTKKRKKEVIDYSAAQKDQDASGVVNSDGAVTTPDNMDADPVGKVQNWLLNSQLPVVIPKSKSTPVGLHKARHSGLKPTAETDKSRSVGHLPCDKDKVRLQVIYKPPFKFSVKLRKADKSSVVVDRSGQRVGDRGAKVRQNVTRTGLLVRPVRDRERRHNRVAPDRPPPPPANKHAATEPTAPPLPPPSNPVVKLPDDIDSNIHTVQSDLEVLLSESEFLFSDD